jgi:hypothetical protein
MEKSLDFLRFIVNYKKTSLNNITKYFRDKKDCIFNYSDLSRHIKKENHIIDLGTKKFPIVGFYVI